VPLAFPIVYRFCMALLYGSAGRLTAENGGGRHLRSPSEVTLHIYIYIGIIPMVYFRTEPPG
jgi:hypothetical protein